VTGAALRTGGGLRPRVTAGASGPGERWPPGGTCTVDVEYTAGSFDHASGELRVTSDDGTACRASLTAQGTSAPAPDRFTFTPDPLELGDVEVGQSRVGTLTVTNAGDRPLELSSFSLDGAGYGFAGTTCFGTSVAPGGTCTVSVTVTSTDAGHRNAEVTAFSQRGTGRAASVTTRFVPSAPDRFTFTPDPLELGDVEVGQSRVGTLTVTNTGDRPLEINAFQLDGPAYGFAGTTCFGTPVAPGGTCTVNVTVTSPDAGHRNAEVIAFSRGGASRAASVTTRVVLPPADSLLLEPAPVDFGAVTEGTSAVRTATVTNTGTRPARVAQTSVSGDGFSLGRSTCTQELAPRASCAVDVAFAAGTPGPAQGSLALVSGDGTRFTVELAALSNAVPQVAVTAAPPALTRETTASIAFSVTDDDRATASCSLDGAKPVACTSPYVVEGLLDGSHRVVVTATDRHGASSSAAASWAVDATAPVLTVPAPTTVDATSPRGAVFSYPATASDARDPAPVVRCSPVSGSTLPIGTTTVLCTASDDLGNSSTASFDVQVRGALEQVLVLRDTVLAEVSPNDLRTTLVKQLDDAAAALRAGEKPCGPLRGFTRQVRAQEGKQLTAEQARRYTADATRIGTVAGC
jgi:hypothetical protein